MAEDDRRSASWTKEPTLDNPICLNSNTYHGYELADAVSGAREAGIHFIEVAAVRGYTEHARSDMSDVEVTELRRLLADNGIEPLGMCGHTNIMTADGREEFRNNLDLAVRLGAKYVVTGTGETHGDEHVIDDDTELVGILRELAAYAAERGLNLAVETHGNNFGTGVRVKDLAVKVGANNFGVNYDTANVIFYGDVEPYDDLRQSADRVIGIHLKDKAGDPREWNFPAVGDGDINFDRIFDILAETRCVAPLSIEVEFTSAGPASVDEVHAAVARSAEAVRTLRSKR
jgi:L-ribulose-5-phosphate 3-epimerase